MSFITSLILIDAPASALNNSGEDIPNARTENTAAVKFIRTQDGKNYPYVSAQAFRYWLRQTLTNAKDIAWSESPIQREEKIAYTAADPITYHDDDLMGYMRAPKGSGKKKKGEETPDAEDKATVTRVAPLRVSTFVSISPVNITADFGTMTRQEDNPVPYEHQFYRTTLVGAVSLNLGMAGKFFYRRRTGFVNLDEMRRQQAQSAGLEHLEGELAYRLPSDERVRRVASLLKGIGRLDGGAKQTLHYTDVAPAVSISAVIRGGNNPFQYVFTHRNGVPVFNADVFQQVFDNLVNQDTLRSPIYIGWKPGYLPEELAKVPANPDIFVTTPQTAFDNLAGYLANNPHLLDE
ncbi:MAG: type I-B CRISPR-associated protein Cas7/Cst2/DevR [Anaerolineae bacterium]|jgi:CRISPR-associated protein Cst2|nr:type I-B CRISPR-associated protein Cas7/Cst2/DevR [Anaerolineae bacterium]